MANAMACPAMAHQFVSESTAREIFRRADEYMTVLAPYLHGNRCAALLYHGVATILKCRVQVNHTVQFLAGPIMRMT